MTVVNVANASTTYVYLQCVCFGLSSYTAPKILSTCSIAPPCTKYRICFKTHPFPQPSHNFQQIMRPFLGVIKSIPSLTSWDSMDFFMSFFLLPCLKLIRPKVGGGSLFKISSSQVGMSDENPHHNNENTSRFLWKKQTNIAKVVLWTWIEFQCFFIEPTKNYLVILSSAVFEHTFRAPTFSNRDRRFWRAGIDLGPIHTSATSRATEKKGRWMHALSCHCCCMRYFWEKITPNFGKDCIERSQETKPGTPW